MANTHCLKRNRQNAVSFHINLYSQLLKDFNNVKINQQNNRH